MRQLITHFRFALARLNDDRTGTGRYALIVVLGALALFFFNVMVDNAVVFHDEYVYKAAADRTLDQHETYLKGLNEYIPNRLFVKVYGLASLAGQNYYVTAQFFNVVFWSFAVLLVCSLAKRLGMRGPTLGALAALSMLLPFSVYSKYFMPESMYLMMFAAAALLFLMAVESGSFLLMAGAGVVAGLTYYVKPHAVLFVVATVGFMVCCTRALPRRWTLCGAYVGGFLLVALLGRLLIHKPPQLASLGVYDQMVRGMLATSTTLTRDPRASLMAIATVFEGHLVTLLSMWTIVFAMLLRSLRALWVAPAKDGGSLAPVQYFEGWLAMVGMTLVAVVVAFTVLIGEVGRIHTRYYAFLFPFFLLVLLAYRPQDWSARAKKAMSAVVLGAGAALLTIPHYSPVLPISLVSDAPEMGFLFAPGRGALCLAGLLIIAQLAAIWRGRLALLLALVIVFAYSQYYARDAQSHIFRGPYTDGRDAVMVEQLMGAERLKSSVVIAENRDLLSKFLFNVSVIPFVRIEPFDKLPQTIADYPAAPAYLLLTDAPILSAGMICEKIGQRVTRCTRQ